MKQSPERRDSNRAPEADAEVNGLAFLLIAGVLFILILLPVVG